MNIRCTKSYSAVVTALFKCNGYIAILLIFQLIFKLKIALVKLYIQPGISLSNIIIHVLYYIVIPIRRPNVKGPLFRRALVHGGLQWVTLATFCRVRRYDPGVPSS